jgi:hypothetical protein
MSRPIPGSRTAGNWTTPLRASALSSVEGSPASCARGRQRGAPPKQATGWESSPARMRRTTARPEGERGNTAATRGSYRAAVTNEVPDEIRYVVSSD